jgi:hypothetical protein
MCTLVYRSTFAIIIIHIFIKTPLHIAIWPEVYFVQKSFCFDQMFICFYDIQILIGNLNLWWYIHIY